MIPCRICSSRESVRLFTKDNLDIVKCRYCGLEYTDALPDIITLKDLYSEKYFRSGGNGTTYSDYIFEAEAMTLNARMRLKNIEKIKPIKGRILDIGCAAGFFLNVAKEKWEVAGVELSEYASSYARDKMGLPVKMGTLKDADFEDSYFDVVTMWDVVEHLNEPLVDLKEIKRIMKDDGVLVISTGDARSLFARMCGRHWHLYNPIQHLSYFTPDTIKRLLNMAGFRVLRIDKEGNYFTLGYIASSLAMYYPSVFAKMIKKVISGTRFKSIKMHLSLGDIMTVYAVKEL